MNRLQHAQKQLAQSLSALESAVEQAQNSTFLAVAGNSAGTADADGSDAPMHAAPAIDTGRLSQDLTAIEADLERAIKMIDNLTTSTSSSGRNKFSL